MTDWGNSGCEMCRRGILSGQGDMPEYVATSLQAHAHLRHCQACGAWWEENEREAHVIGEDEARATFPMHFGE